METIGRKYDDPHWTLVQVSRLLKLFGTMVLALIAVCLGLGISLVRLSEDQQTNRIQHHQQLAAIADTVAIMQIAALNQHHLLTDVRATNQQLDRRLSTAERRLRMATRRLTRVQAKLDSLSQPPLALAP